MMNVLKNKVAVITGSSRGLGFAMAQIYAREGASVVISSRSAPSVASAVETLKAQGANVAGMACNVADLEQVKALADFAVKIFGKIDVWVNNAGISATYGPTAHIPSQNFMDVINTNIIGTYNGSVVALRHFLPQKSGKLINLLGRGDNNPVPFQNAYGSSKTWVRNFTRTLAKEYGDSGVGVYAFNPGLIRTEMLSQVHALAGFEKKMNPLRFVAAIWGNESDVPARKALWLASSQHVKTGTEVNIINPWFMVKRLVSAGIGWLFRHPVEISELNITSVQPVMEFSSVSIEEK
jgi:NAD(P)-dependent dehydrogenase (short-subunit alcohol dehydrogenase family)